MRVMSHVDKVRRMTLLRGRLDPTADFDLWYWTTLTAGTNMLNATLHLAGITRDDPVFSSIPGVHLVQQPDGSYARELRGLGDVSHVGWPEIEGEVPERIRRLERALHAIEHHRDPCIRGDRVATPAIVDECARAFAEVLSIFQQALKESGIESREP